MYKYNLNFGEVGISRVNEAATNAMSFAKIKQETDYMRYKKATATRDPQVYILHASLVAVAICMVFTQRARCLR